MTTDYIEVESQGKNYWWRVKARNGQILATSETYARLRGARRMAKRFAKRHGIAVRGEFP